MNSETTLRIAPLREPMVDVEPLWMELLDAITLALGCKDPRAGMLLLDRGAGIAIAKAEREAPDDVRRELLSGLTLRDMFEAWLVERWLTEVRSPAFRSSVQYDRLRAEWERST